MIGRLLWFLLVLTTSALAQTVIPPIERRLPPEGLELDQAQATAAQAALDKIQQLLKDLPTKAAIRPDIEILEKAMRYAILHREFYDVKQLARADYLVSQAQAVIQTNKSTADQPGLHVHGYHSSIDGSPQPYGLEIPEGLDLGKPAPLYVWLHGRGDKTTDIHFIHERLTKPGRFQPANAIVLHPFGRHCLGFKSAGEIDVIEAMADVQKRYRIDANRIALMGFSMGGAGAWHIGAHYNDRFAIVHPGAGFAETAQYNRLKPADYPSPFEQRLWGLYDVPNYVRNLFNGSVIAYSGEIDKQIQAARVMEAAFQTEGRTLQHVIGPGMGHKYDPVSQNKISEHVARVLEKGRPIDPNTVHLQTRTLRYARQHWLEATGLKQHWDNAQITATHEDSVLKIATVNVTSLTLHRPFPKGTSVEIDGSTLTIDTDSAKTHLQLGDTGWRFGKPNASQLRKKPGLQGPIDDAFVGPFLVVKPSREIANPLVQAWVDFELKHFITRWRALYRGDLNVVTADQVTDDLIATHHLILWGDPESNPLIHKAVTGFVALTWDSKGISIGRQAFTGDTVPLAIFPNPLNPERYVVLNSGPTFRENHDRTNSLQNPKLPDWAVIDLNQAPDGDAPGKVVNAGFFNESWLPAPNIPASSCPSLMSLRTH